MSKDLSVIKKNSDIDKYNQDGDNHFSSNLDSTLLDKAFELSDKEKINIIQEHFRSIMIAMGLDLSDDSLKGTPYRVAKMYVKEIFKGLDPDKKPQAMLFENKFEYGKMLLEKNISFYSFCEHHFLPFYGTAHVGYISSGKVVGLSKIHRIVNYFSKRPQVQERLTVQIFKELKNVLGTEDVAILLEASHLCVSSRGIKDITSTTVTMESGGIFKDDEKWSDFLSIVVPDKVKNK
ncbi:MAG: GTP cyclohydrolase I FolE [Pelagibacteraceae bacterium TMED237]|nr:GTP cyclohydrolase I FolE [Candidatus Neomarinimicrobiota bacterium]OUW96743.1 MAG: GTP cyclohydrolase I FolE [Pelagibacteraceae bacterium TMED237]|tara:strand:- start:2667 stop:3371 length:705 start_codon:yes stop_codon:yes gene_type:complete